MLWWETVGWVGSLLVVVSLVVPSVRRFRVLNLSGSLVATAYNLAFGIWPYAAMNAVIAVIDVYWLARLRSQGARSYRVLEVDARGELVRDFLTRHRAQVLRAHPSLPDVLSPGARALLTLHEDEVVGLFVCEPHGCQARVLVDFVTERFRDLKPGRALYSSPVVRAGGLERMVVEAGEVGDAAYFRKQGFVERDGRLVLDLRKG